VFRSDFEDGSLEQFLLSAHPVSILVMAKVLAHWLVTGLPLLIVAPLLGVLLDLPGASIKVVMLTLVLGTPVLSLVGSIGVALTVGLRRGGMILSLLVLPLYVPVLIFAANAVETAAAGLPITAHLSMLSGLLVLALSLSREFELIMNRISRLYHQLGSPRYFYRYAGYMIPWLAVSCAILMLAGLYQGLVVAPADYQQGDSYRIMFVHVPAAWMSMFVYVVMAACGAIALIWHMKLAEIFAISSAHIGASFTFLALVTGSIWGKPMWGTWWVWDARLTSELILLFLYLGVIALYNAIDDKRTAARATGILAIVGVVNIPISQQVRCPVHRYQDADPVVADGRGLQAVLRGRGIDARALRTAGARA
jgi:heme exporter protein C